MSCDGNANNCLVYTTMHRRPVHSAVNGKSMLRIAGGDLELGGIDVILRNTTLDAKMVRYVLPTSRLYS